MGIYILFKARAAHRAKSAERLAAGCRRRASSPASSMPAAAAAGDRSRRRRWSDPVTRRGGRSVRSTPTEFFVTIAAATTFFVELGASPMQQLVPLVLGGVFAAPFGGWAVKRMPARLLMIAVGAADRSLAVWQLARAFKFV